MTRRYLALLAAFATLPAACEAVPSSSDQPIQAYQCGDLLVEARFEDDAALLTLPGEDLRLPQVISASGVRYNDGANELWTKGMSDALLTLAGQDLVACRAVDRRSPWAEARERGVVLRVVGNEPGWLAEAGHGETPPLRVVLDYGERQLDFERSEKTADPDGYRAEADGVAVVLEVFQEACADTMSGESFPLRAELSVDGRTLDGCGRFLAE